jgi:hypothetical protein
LGHKPFHRGKVKAEDLAQLIGGREVQIPLPAREPGKLGAVYPALLAQLVHGNTAVSNRLSQLIRQTEALRFSHIGDSAERCQSATYFRVFSARCQLATDGQKVAQDFSEFFDVAY